VAQTLPHHVSIPLTMAILAVSVAAFVWFMPEAWAGHAALRSSLSVITLAWSGRCMVRVGQAGWWRRRWTRNQVWQVGPDTLPRLAPRPQQGLYLGEGFPWNGQYTQRLEQAIAVDGALPVSTDTQGGHPALQAVGAGAAQAWVIPWPELEAHVGVTGTTRSGKTTLLEVFVEEAIRA
jgi:hypothetical protein